MLNRPNLPGFQHLQLNTSTGTPVVMTRNNAVMPTSIFTTCANPNASGDWHLNGDDELRRLRSNNVVIIERMLRNHQPHEVLNHVPENTDWRSKTFNLALKVERLMFKVAKSRAEYLNAHTLPRRVKILCRYLVPTVHAVSCDDIQLYTIRPDGRSSRSLTLELNATMSISVNVPPNDIRMFDNSWVQIGQDLRVERWKNVVNIDRMLRNHRPHEVLTHVEQNTNWYAKTFTLALKVERIIFEAASSRKSYLNEKTLRARVSQVSRKLIDLRKHKNMSKFRIQMPRQLMMMKRGVQ
ncbi:hypothetical protein BBJ29_003419 [Phytophthora kernoviae]|uniref:Uncharacterized protein n=1 Tax=Phytophthora kernoviae TaxID=325452 RepID=A0A421G4X7_9STRA|nr:hypothetical protein BBJ29_003419 [Phytophthora kernoviae]